MLCEQLEYNLLFRWFVGLGLNEQTWVPTVFTKNRDRLLRGDIAEAFLVILYLTQFKGAASMGAWCEVSDAARLPQCLGPSRGLSRGSTCCQSPAISMTALCGEPSSSGLQAS